MSKQVKIEDKEVILKRVKWKERKELIDQFGDKIQSTANMIFPEKGELTSERNLFDTACYCVMENTEDIEKLIIKYTDLDSDQLGEFDVYQVTMLVGELIKYNGINVPKVKDFFAKSFNFVQTLSKQVPQQKKEFVEKL